jgi:hypothetical protein
MLAACEAVDGPAIWPTGRAQLIPPIDLRRHARVSAAWNGRRRAWISLDPLCDGGRRPP